MDAILNVSQFDNTDLNLESAIAQDDFESDDDSDAGVWRFNSADDIIKTDTLNDPYDSTAWELLFERTLEAGCDGNGGDDFTTEGDISADIGASPTPTSKRHHTVK